jgi:integrative and conjugative element protein (TIGR02256 family)
MRRERRRRLPAETGGFLIGKRRGPYIEITDITTQGPADEATASSFERADKKHTKLVLDKWKADGGFTSLVGDWHTHPFGDGSPSLTDERGWSALTAATKADCAALIFGENESIKAFLIIRGLLWNKIVPLSRIDDDDHDLIFGSSTAKSNKCDWHISREKLLSKKNDTKPSEF